jgi:hypothetical protein
MRIRFGEPASDWDEFCAAYSFDPSQLPGLPVLLQMREPRALAAYLRSPSPAAQPEATHRLTDLMTGTQARLWTAHNLATRPGRAHHRGRLGGSAAPPGSST